MPAFAAAAAALGRELTLPEHGADRDPDPHRGALLADAASAKTWRRSAPSGATLAIHLSIDNLARVVRELTPHLRRRLPGGRRLSRQLAGRARSRGTLADIRDTGEAAGITRTALILVGRVLAAENFPQSWLYAADHHHLLRPRRSSDG